MPKKKPSHSEAVGRFVRKVSGTKDARLPHVAEFLEALLDECGGVRKVAKRFALGLESAQPGSLIEHRYLDCLSKLILYLSKTLDAAQQEEGLLTDADLERELKAYLPAEDDDGQPSVDARAG